MSIIFGAALGVAQAGRCRSPARQLVARRTAPRVGSVRGPAIALAASLHALLLLPWHSSAVRKDLGPLGDQHQAKATVTGKKFLMKSYRIAQVIRKYYKQIMHLLLLG